MDERTYTSEEAEAILLHANRVDPQTVAAPVSGPVSSEQLRSMGEEIGLTPEQIRAAEDQYLREKVGSVQGGSQFAQFLEQAKERTKAKIRNFVGFAVMMLGINAVTSPGTWWSLLPVGIVGAITASDIIKNGIGKPTENSREFERWRQRQNRSNQDRYVRNRQAEEQLDAYFKDNPSRDRIRAVEFLNANHGFEIEEAKDAVDDYWRRRAW
ncbi:MAG: hypothetical protein JNJ45_00675 [Chthonomonas sp.]|nr:hypothetical protein [Chthonomonas sp.]